MPLLYPATHIAAPARYTVGELAGEEARALMLRRTNRPRAARRFAACIYAKLLGYLPQHRGRAAQFLHLPAPPPVDNLIEPAREKPPP